MLIGIKRVAEILGVDKTTVYGYIRQGLIPNHAKKIKPEGCRTWARVWVESEIAGCVASIAAHNARPQDHSKRKNNTGRKVQTLRDYDLATSLMSVSSGGRL